MKGEEKEKRNGCYRINMTTIIIIIIIIELRHSRDCKFGERNRRRS